MNQRHPALGFALALTASMTWGSLPIAAQQVLQVLDAATLVWFRFLFAAVVLLGLGWWRGTLPRRAAFGRRQLVLLAMGSLALTLNFVLFAASLYYVSPTTTQVLWQLAPFGMMIGGVWVFGERMGAAQKVGLALLVLGLVAFFNQNFAEILQFGAYAKGIALAVAASLIWVVYGMVQKLLLPQFSSAQILVAIYLACSLWLLPFAEPAQITAVSGWTWAFFAFCCLNTLIGYGAYGEALNRWEASKVSVITTMLPVFTMLFSWLAHTLNPGWFPPLRMNILSYAGALVVVAGAVMAVAGNRLFAKPKS